MSKGSGELMSRTDELTWQSTPIPAARAIEHFSATEVGDGEIVLFDNERLTYHTLNAPAFAVWQLCDGVRTSSEISGLLAQSGTTLPVEAVELAVLELGDSGLVGLDVSSPDAKLTRRRVVKLAAAGALGAAVIPTVASITASVSAHHTSCPVGGQLLHGHCENPTCSCVAPYSCCCVENFGDGLRTCGRQAGGSNNCSDGSYTWVC